MSGHPYQGDGTERPLEPAKGGASSAEDAATSLLSFPLTEFKSGGQKPVADRLLTAAELAESVAEERAPQRELLHGRALLALEECLDFLEEPHAVDRQLKVRIPLPTALCEQQPDLVGVGECVDLVAQVDHGHAPALELVFGEHDGERNSRLCRAECRDKHDPWCGALMDEAT